MKIQNLSEYRFKGRTILNPIMARQAKPALYGHKILWPLSRQILPALPQDFAADLAARFCSLNFGHKILWLEFRPQNFVARLAASG